MRKTWRKMSGIVSCKGSLNLVMGGFLLISLLGCQTAKPFLFVTETPQDAVPRLVLGPGDSIEVKFFYNPELNDIQIVRPDGRITLQLVGEVVVQGKTVDELRDHLVRLYAPELRIPEIAVIVRLLSERRVYVGGEVNRPGIIPMPGRLTILEAVVEAGGFKTETAGLKSVVVIRQRDGKYVGTIVNLREALEGKKVEAFYLAPRDIVYVPQTAIAKVDQWVDQFIYKLLPLSKAGMGIYWTPGL